MAFKQSTVVSSEYSMYDADASKWVAYSLRTNATDIVLNSSNRLFIQNDNNTINGKKFYSVNGNTYTPQAIVLTGNDINTTGSSGTSISSALGVLDRNCFKITGGTVTGETTFSDRVTFSSVTAFNKTPSFNKGITIRHDSSVADIEYGGGSGPSRSINLPDNDGTLALDGVATASSKGLMSTTDKSHLDSMWNLWSADGTNDTLVNKIEEVLTAFSNFPESSNIVTLLSNKQDKVGVLGSTTRPVYVSASGTFSECSAYAGGTLVNLNGTSKSGTSVNIYTPTSFGSSGQILKSNGDGKAPTWFTPDYATISSVPSIYISSTTPPDPKAGDVWINTAA